MPTIYDNFASYFSRSREGMRWREIDYFLHKINSKAETDVLDIWCGNGRLLEMMIDKWLELNDYTWIDLSEWLLKLARSRFPLANFISGDMLNLWDIKVLSLKKFDYIFLIASFHHLDNLDERLSFLNSIKFYMKMWARIYMINWAIQYWDNEKKYKNSLIEGSENIYWWKDYNIKIRWFDRFYHAFSLEELEYLFYQTWYKIIENRIFEEKRNIVSELYLN